MQENKDLRQKLDKLEGHTIAPEELFAAIEHLVDSSACSYNAFCELTTKLRLNGSLKSDSATAAATSHDKLQTTSSELAHMESGEEKNKTALRCISEVTRFTNEVEHAKRDIIGKLPEFESLRDSIQ
jgi:hypothetical protein